MRPGPLTAALGVALASLLLGGADPHARSGAHGALETFLPTRSVGPLGPGPDASCKSCHDGIEEMHPWAPLGCVECHGGDGRATSKEAAHVAPSSTVFGDERTAPLDADLAYRRFLNPGDLRVTAKTCGRCHQGWCADLKKSPHGTTSGHLSDGLYENGVFAKRTAVSIFPVVDDDGSVGPHGLKELKAVGGFAGGPADEIATHYRDVARKSCMQCHLWSRGRAVRGRLGLDGDYRSEGCSACHVTYSDRGFSESADRSIDKNEPGRPRKHQMTSKIPTDTCTRCHYGDASIGTSFRGLAQLVPGQPAGPDVPGTTGKRLNGTFYANDPRTCPPDVHHERGMHCIDCHTARDVMGDGDIYPHMDHAVEVECSSCHGTLERRTDGRTSKGAILRNLKIEGPDVWLTSKVTGKKHRVKQARDVIDPRSPDFNARAREAMTSVHGNVECYACHASWNANFFGFHFDRNESFSQLDLISGERTPGRVTTQEKVFATFKQLTLGLNHEGRFAPYMVGFSTFCSAHDKTGAVVIDQEMPRTGAGLSGMTMIHHQPHTVRNEARSCAECHRAGAAYGLGSGSFSLARGLVLTASTRGVVVTGVDRKTPDQSVALAEVRLGPTRDVAMSVDAIHGRTTFAYAATDRGVTVLDLAHPAFPTIAAEIPLPEPALRVLATEARLYVSAGKGGVFLFDVKNPRKPVLLSRLGVTDAHGLALAGLRLYVADGVKGLVIADVSDPQHPTIASFVPLGNNAGSYAAATEVAVHFLFSRPLPGGGRTRARQIAAIGGPGIGLRLIDVTEPSRPRGLGGNVGKAQDPLRELGSGRRPTGLAFTAKFDLGSTGGGVPTAEHDDLYVATAGEGGEGVLFVVRMTDPDAPKIVDRVKLDSAATGLAVQKLYNAPFLVHGAAVATRRSLQLVDLTLTGQGAVKATILPGNSGGIAVEAMPFDRMITEDGIALKDIAHEDARYANAAELRRLLFAPIPDPAEDDSASETGPVSPAPPSPPRKEDR